MKIPKPRFGEITAEELETHLTEECGLSIICPMEIEYDVLTKEERALLKQFPEHEHPSWNIGTSEVWEPEQDQWYDQMPYDRVLVSSLQDKEQATAQLLRMSMRRNCRRTGDVFFSAGNWCVRVLDIES